MWPPLSGLNVRSQAGGGGEGGGGEGAGGARPVSELERPFGLPRRLRLDALARRRGRVLRARSDRYLHTLYTVAVFYALPVVQFVAAFQILMNVSGSLDICYYNFLCAHPAGALADFNHEYGIPAHYGMLGALGAGMMVVALLSASYHVCPNRLNFQFEPKFVFLTRAGGEIWASRVMRQLPPVRAAPPAPGPWWAGGHRPQLTSFVADVAFMYVLAVLSMVKIYQARHPDVNARAHATFGVLALLIALVVWGVLGGGALFWGAATVLHVFSVLLLSLRIYYRWRRAGCGGCRAGAGAGRRRGRGGPAQARPLYAARLVLLLIANAVNWGFALYG
ncbi:hypothetical protein MSG28_006046 [Choristoneura fumiferana]|uniref:Uncharacterized protein n=1 Tax=Choristoneura fumiferana TaxID=7141 RepID=A0ACC0JDF5_CHOFU|nr:hypothetical protein MSG28_006046 [Choristoneura fumiferana]